MNETQPGNGITLEHDDARWETWSAQGVSIDALPTLARLVLKEPLAGYSTFDAVCDGATLSTETLTADTASAVVDLVTHYAHRFYLVTNDGERTTWRLNVYRRVTHEV